MREHPRDTDARADHAGASSEQSEATSQHHVTEGGGKVRFENRVGGYALPRTGDNKVEIFMIHWQRILRIEKGAVAVILVSFGPFHVMPAAARLGVGALYFALAFVYVPPVLFLHRYASRIRDLVDEPSTRNLEEALRSQKSFWKYIGMFTVIAIGVYFLVLLGILAVSVLMTVGRR